MIVSTPNSSIDRTAKRLHDPTLSSRAFAIFFIVTILIAITLLLAPKAGAATDTYTSTTGGALNVNGNWSTGAVPITTDEALFTTQPSTNTTLSVGNSNLTFGDLIWNQNTSSGITGSTGSRTLTLSGGGGSTAAIANGGATGDLFVLGTSATTNTLTFGSASLGLILGANGNFDVVNSGATLSIVGVLSGAFNLTKTGAGTLTLSGANTFGAAKLFTLSAGTLNINSATALGSATNTFQINGGTTIDNTSGAAITISNNNPLTLNGDFTFTGGSGTTHDLNLGTGAVSLGAAAGTTRMITASAGILTIGGVISNGTTANSLTKAGGGTLVLNGANLFTGGVTINAGTLRLGSATALGPAANASVAFGSGSTGKLQLNGNNVTIVDLNTNATVGTPIIESGSGTAGTDTLTVNTANTDTYAGVLQNGSTRLLALTKSGAGTLKLSGTNTYTGATIISASGGTLTIDNNNTTTSGRLANTSSVTVNSGGTLLLAQSSGGTANNDRINNSATMTLNGGKFNTGGLSEHGGSNNTAGIGALTLQSSSIIDMGSAASIVAFADSHLSTWSGTISIYNWSGDKINGGGTDQLYFGTNTSGLTSTQLSEFQFYSDAGTTPFLAGAIILSTGEVVPVPEPSTWIGGALTLGAIGFMQRRRLCSRRISELVRVLKRDS